MMFARDIGYLKSTNLAADFTGYVTFFIAPPLYTLPMSKLHAKWEHFSRKPSKVMQQYYPTTQMIYVKDSLS